MSRVILFVSTLPVESHISRIHTTMSRAILLVSIPACPEPHYSCPHFLSRATLLVSTPACPEPHYSCPHPLSGATFLVSTPPVRSHISRVHIHLPHQFNAPSPTKAALCAACCLLTSYQHDPNCWKLRTHYMNSCWLQFYSLLRKLLSNRLRVRFSCSAVYILRYRTLLAVTTYEVKAELRISVCSTKAISRNDTAAETIPQAFYVVPILARVDRMPSTAPNRAGNCTRHDSSSTCGRGALCE